MLLTPGTGAIKGCISIICPNVLNIERVETLAAIRLVERRVSALGLP